MWRAKIAPTQQKSEDTTMTSSLNIEGKSIVVTSVAPGILEATGFLTLPYETALAYTRG